MPKLTRRVVAAAVTALLATAGLVATSGPAAAFDPTDPMASCGAGAAAAPWEIRTTVALDARYTAVDTKTLTVGADAGLKKLVGKTTSFTSTPSADDLLVTQAMFDRGRFLLYAAPQHGVVDLAPDGTFSYTPNLGVTIPDGFPTLSVPDSFAYFFQFDDQCSTVAQVRFDIVERIDTAAAQKDTYAFLDGTDALAPVPAERGVLVNDTTPEGRVGPGGLRAVLTSQPTSPWGSPGTVDLAADGGFQLHLGPAGAGNTTFTFTYKACPIYMTQYSVNGGGCSDNQTVEVTADPTTAVDDVYDMPPGSTVLAATTPGKGVLANDPSWGLEGRLSWRVVTQPRHGTLTATTSQAAGGAFTYTPDSSFTGMDSFTYIRCAARNETVCPSPPATVTIRRASVPRVVSISAPSPTSGGPLVIELSEPVRGVDASRVQLRGPGSSVSPAVDVSFQCQVVLPPSAEWSYGAVITNPCGPATVANRIVLTPTVPLVSPALYTVVLNPSGTAMPGVDTGLQLPTTVRTIAVTAPQGVAPQIVQEPEDLTVRPLGGSAVFSAAVLGNPQPVAQWQVSGDGGGSWSDLPAKLGSTLVVRPEDAVDGQRYRVTFSNEFGSVTSRVATLAVGNAPVVTLHPTDRTNESLVTSAFSFTAAADGVPAPSVQWEESLDGGASWADLPGETSNTMTRIGAGIDGALYRARFSNNAGTVRSNPAEVFVVPPFQEKPTVTRAPQDQLVYQYDLATFSVEVAGVPAPTVQWQWALAGSDEFVDIDGSTGPTIEIQGDPGTSGTRLRAAVRNAAGRVYSAPATLTLTTRPAPTPPTLTSGPADLTVGEGGDAHFSASAVGSPAPFILWQTSADGGDTWALEQTQTGPTYVIGAVTAEQNGLRVRAIALNEGGSVTGPAALLTVVPDPPPTLSLPETMDVVATGPDGAVVQYDATASDNDPAAPTVSCAPASGSVFPVGETQVTCRAADVLGHEVTGTFLVRVAAAAQDTEPPTLAGSPSLLPAPNSAGWNTSPVTLTWEWSDAGSGVDPARCTTSRIVTTTRTVTASCTDQAGNTTTSPPTTVRIDSVAPTLAPWVPSTLLLGASAAAKPGAADAGGSGLDSSTCGALETATIGRRTVTCTATDRAGNTTTISRSYTVLARVSSFQSRPVALRGTTLTARFTLAGADGRLTSSAAAALAAAKVVRIALTGPRIAADAPLTALCTWNRHGSTYECPLALPRNLASGLRNPYTLTVQLATAPGTWTTAPGTKNKVRLSLI
jgi:hypothetical protein